MSGSGRVEGADKPEALITQVAVQLLRDNIICDIIDSKTLRLNLIYSSGNVTAFLLLLDKPVPQSSI